MKKFFAILLSAAIVFSFGGCSIFDDESNNINDGASEEYIPVDNSASETAQQTESTTIYSGVYLGQSYMYDGQTYEIKQGDTLDLVIPDIPSGCDISSHWYYGGSVTAVWTEHNNLSTVYAISPGEGTIGVYYSISDGKTITSYHLEAKVMVEGVWPELPTGTGSGNSYTPGSYLPDSSCDRCHGTGLMECPSCEGKGYISTPSNPCRSSYCNGGYVPCPCY